MIVTVKPKVPIRGVTRNVIISEQTLDLNLFQIKKCMRLGTVTCNGEVLTVKNVDEIYSMNGVAVKKTEEVVQPAPQEVKTEEPVVETPVVEEVKTEEPVVETTVEEKVEETPVVEETASTETTNTYSSKKKNKNNK